MCIGFRVNRSLHFSGINAQERNCWAPQTQQSKQDEKAENIQQIKEHDKCPPNQTKEEEIRSLSEKEFRIMIVKMIQKS